MISLPSSDQKKTRTRKTKTETETSSTLFEPIQANTDEPVGLEAEIADLKRRYEAGEQPTDRPGREGREELKQERKRRTKKEMEAEQTRAETFSASLGLLSKVAAALVCSALPNPLPPSELEVQILNDSLSAVAQKHFDKLLEFDAELSLTIAVCAIIIPRLRRDKPPQSVEPLNIVEAVEAAKKQETADAAQSNS